MTTAARLRIVDEKPLRTALYARYSSDIQNDQSIERQNADLEKVAPRLNLKLDKQNYCEDRAQSATSLFDRPGLTRRLLTLAEKGLIDAVLVEHTDRLSREPADAYWLKAQLKFHNVKVFTPAGEVTDLQWAFESYQNAADIEKIRFRVRSGFDEKARKGLIMNGAPYGYSEVLGKPGEKIINETEAKIIVRMFSEFRDGSSPRTIACGLTRDGVPSPSGGAWTFQTIHKMLQNSLYAGLYVRNRMRRIKNPNNGRRLTRAGSPEDLVETEIPHLRILDQSLWAAVQRVRNERGNKPIENQKVERATVARNQEPFGGLFRCGTCGDRMIICSTDRRGHKYVACSTAHWKSTCPQRKTYDLTRLTKLAAEKMHEHLTDPEFVKERAKERAKDLARMEREDSTDREATQRELDRVDLRIRKLIRLTEDDEGEDVPQEAVDRLKQLRVERRGLEQRLHMLGAQTNVTPLHDNNIKALARDVDTLHAMLRDDPSDPACRIAVANLIERVLVHPTEQAKPYEVSLYARHAAYVGELPLFPEYKSKKHQQLSGSNNVNATVPSLTLSQPVYLGRWREAA